MTLVGLTALSVEIMHEVLDARRRRASRPAVRVPSDVVLDRLAGVRLHHRHVLVGGGVEDDLRAIQLEDRLHSLAERMSRISGTTTLGSPVAGWWPGAAGWLTEKGRLSKHKSSW